MRQTFAIGIGGAAGQGVATPGDIFAKIFSRRGLHLNAYNAYQSIIRGGHTFLTIRTGPEKVTQHGRPHRFADPAESGHHGSPPGPAHRGRRVYLQRGHDPSGHCRPKGVQLCPLPGLKTGRHHAETRSRRTHSPWARP